MPPPRERLRGFYPDWKAKLGGFYTSRNKFEITRLVVDGAERPPVKSKTFNRLLYPGLRKPEVPGFPPPRTFGMKLVCNENWVLNWEKGHRPKSDYSTPSYKPPDE